MKLPSGANAAQGEAYHGRQFLIPFANRLPVFTEIEKLNDSIDKRFDVIRRVDKA